MSPPPKTEAEKGQLISKLRHVTSEYIDDPYWLSDGFLYKWIEDRSYNVERAEKGIRKCLKWRIENNIDNILEEDFHDLEQNITYFNDGLDKEGRIVITIPSDLCNVSSSIENGNQQRLKRGFLQIVEKIAIGIRKNCLDDPKSPSTFTGIIDFLNIDASKAETEIIKFCVSTAVQLEDNYPGFIEKIFVINASRGVKNIHKFAIAALRKKTSERIQVFGRKRHKWEPEILKSIDADQIRLRFGGTKPDHELNECNSITLANLNIKD